MLARYQMATFTSVLGIYTFVHESGHMLFGWPDLYGFGDYCVMGNSSSQSFGSNVSNTGRWAALRGSGLLFLRFVGKRRSTTRPTR